MVDNLGDKFIISTLVISYAVFRMYLIYKKVKALQRSAPLIQRGMHLLISNGKSY